MAKKGRRHSIYKSTALAAFASVMVAFGILSFVYYGIMNDRVSRLQSSRVYTLATTLRDEIEKVYSENTSRLTLNDRIDLLAKSSHAIIWLVRSDGIIIHASELPTKVIANCQNLGGGLYQLPDKYIGSNISSRDGVVLQNSEYTKLFSSKGLEWITAMLPVSNDHDTSTAQAILQVHLPSLDQYNLHWFLTNGFGIAFLVALIISIALTLILMNYLTLPLEALVDAANKVMLGDYSVRVCYSDMDTFDTLDNAGSEGDDVMKLMLTFNAMVARLEAVSGEQRDMISCISHDMKTPLTSIIGFTEGILDGTIPYGRQEKYLRIIQQEALRLKNLLADMNQEVLIENSVSNNFNDFDINAVFVRTINSLENQLREKNLSVEMQLEGKNEAPLFVTGDVEQISRVVYNLISNATKFCRNNDVVRVSTAYPEGAMFVTCTVEDSGPGVPPDKRNQVFARFYKLDKSRGNREGSGLGLYICRKILAKHGQQIYVTQSNDLGGAKFVFTLPAAGDQQHIKDDKAKTSRRLFFSRHDGFSTDAFDFPLLTEVGKGTAQGDLQAGEAVSASEESEDAVKPGETVSAPEKNETTKPGDKDIPVQDACRNTEKVEPDEKQ